MRIVATLLLLLAPALAAEEERAWLPAGVVEGASRQLAGRMEQVGLGAGGDDAKLLAGARRMVLAIAADLDARGETGIEKLAPTFEPVELPRAEQRELDLMARYNVCNLLLLRQLQDPAFRDDANAMLTSTLGLTALTMVIVYLREPFVAAGNDVRGIEAHLTDPGLQPIFDRIQQDLELRAAVETTCQPVVTELLARPLEELGGE